MRLGKSARIARRNRATLPGNHLRDEAGQVRRFVNIYVNEEDIRFLGGNDYKFREGDRVLVVPSIAGGAPEDDCG
jgi:molybdopterin converting factor small subunit